MGIRLDWEIEAESSTVQNAGEDPDAARARRRARLRLLLIIVVVLALVGGSIGFVVYRLNDREAQIERLLRDTVTAEMTALRIGDWQAFAEAQRSASSDWLVQQRELFDQYQQIILTSDSAQLTGRILEVEVDDPRARVHVEEIVDGVPYTRVWFYWRYEPEYDTNGREIFAGGWRHVPPDYTFWGEERTYRGQAVTVNYRAVDELFANQVGDRLAEWVNVACDALSCQSRPEIRVEIAPRGVPEMDWAEDDLWLLQLRSPYMSRARSDLPFTPELQIEAASLLAERIILSLVGDRRAVYPADANFLQQAVNSWLVGRFVLIDTHTYLISSLASTYGDGAVGRLLKVMQPNSDVSVISQVTGSSLDQSNLDWRDFFTWRLSLETELIAAQNAELFLGLYDTRDEGVRDAAYQRFGQPPLEENLVVVQVQATDPGPEGAPQRVATVRIGPEGSDREMQVRFRLVDNVWLRAS